MLKALATLGTGPAARLLDLSLPTFRDYASRHNYDVVVGSEDGRVRWPPWGKIPLLQRLLTSYDFVLWIDADALILDPSLDVETVIPADSFQALMMTENPTPGPSPRLNTGVWAFRAGTKAQRFLAQLWPHHESHVEEQSPAMQLLGWAPNAPIPKLRATEWDSGTFLLDETWNMIPWGPIGYAPGRIRHYAGFSNRHRLFDMRTDLAAAEGHRARYWLGRFERSCRRAARPVLRTVVARKKPKWVYERITADRITEEERTRFQQEARARGR